MPAPGSAEVLQRRPRVRRIVVALFSGFMVLVLATAGVGSFLQQRLARHLHRIDGVFSGLTNRPPRPAAAYRLLDTVSRHLSVDSSWSNHDMLSMVISLRNLRSYQIRKLTVPTEAPRHAEGARSGRLDNSGNRSLWNGVCQDKVSDWLADSSATFLTGVAW